MTDAALIATPGAESTIATSQRVKVLLVDDRYDKRLALTAILDGLDLELITANSGREALRLVLSHEFAVILLDVSMPLMDGIETASLIRQRKISEHLPIIFITAFMDTDVQATRGYALGAVDFIYAPVVPAVLRAKVQVFVDLFKKNRELKRQSELLQMETAQRVAILESRLDCLLNRLHVGVYRLTREGVLVSANPSFLKLFGIDSTVSMPTVNFFDVHLDAEDSRVIHARLSAEGQVEEYSVMLRGVDGIITWISLSESLVFDAFGVPFIDGLAEDVTGRKKAEAELIAKAEALARSNAELEEFAYVASHDLQEPLRTVSSYASLLTRRYAHLLDDKGRLFLSHLVKGSTQMQALVRDILAFSKIGKMSTEIAVNCNVVVQRVIFNLEDSINASGAQITHELLPTIQGDPILLGQLFQNLLSNALKFRHVDRVPTVHIRVARKEDRWLFSITDNGIGIPTLHFEKIFCIFQRLHTHDNYVGTGIGLAICRKAVQKLGGTITVESELGVGSAFHIMLPGGLDLDALPSPEMKPGGGLSGVDVAIRAEVWPYDAGVQRTTTLQS